MLTLGCATLTASSSTGTNRMLIFFFVYLFNQSDFHIYIKKIGLVQKFFFLTGTKKVKKKNWKQAFDD